MRRNNRSSVLRTILMFLLCLVLFVFFAGFLVWNQRTEAAETRRLQEQAEKTKDLLEKSGKQKKTTETEKRSPKKKSDKQSRDSQEEESENTEDLAEGIAFWGDEFFSEEELQYSYKNKVNQMLTEQGYSLEIADKTLYGAGSLSVMKMAGVAQTDLDKYIARHQITFVEGETSITETGIRDLTQEQLARTEADYLPVIMMGYYGGWNYDPAELAEQEQKILDTFGKYKDDYIIVGVRPFDGRIDMNLYDQVMKARWGEHYISGVEVCRHTSTTAEGQQEIAQAVFDKLVTLGYIAKEQEG